MTKTQKRALTALVVALAVGAVALPDLAHAQGQITGVTNWGVTNVAKPLISAGVVAVGAVMLLLRIHYSIVIAWAVGGLVIANYQAIAGLLGGT